MSNRKKRKILLPVTEQTVLLSEENKEEVASRYGYSIEFVEDILAKARAQGYSAVRFPVPKSMRG